MKMTTLIGVSTLATLALPAMAQMPTPTAKRFVMMAAASDTFELAEAKLMTSSANPDVSSFAQQMVTDHTKSTDMVKAAAKADGLVLAPAVMTPKQKADLASLKASHGTARDALYIKQQKPAHQQALSLMQTYAASGKAAHLKDTAGQIVPVVQGHIAMLDKMPTT